MNYKAVSMLLKHQKLYRPKRYEVVECFDCCFPNDANIFYVITHDLNKLINNTNNDS